MQIFTFVDDFEASVYVVFGEKYLLTKLRGQPSDRASMYSNKSQRGNSPFEESTLLIL